MTEPAYSDLGLITRVDAHVESAFVSHENGTVELGRCSLRLDHGKVYIEPLPGSDTLGISKAARPVAAKRLGWLLRMNAWCESIPASQLRAFDRIATLAGKCVLTGAAVYLMLEVANAWIAGRFRFGGN